MLQAGNNHKQSWMGLSLFHVRSSLTILLYKDIYLTYSGTPQPLRQVILVLHCSLSQWHTKQYGKDIQSRH